MNVLPPSSERQMKLSSEFAESGGLLAYGPSLRDEFRRVVAQVERIVKGAKPESMPVEQPVQFDLTVNLKTAESLGVQITESVLNRASYHIR